MPCEQARRVEAYVDGELNAADALALEQHLEKCAQCATLRGQLEAMRALVRKSATYHRADAQLRAKIGVALDKETARSNVLPWFRNVWAGAAGGAMATALAASLAFFVLLPETPDPLLTVVTDAHLRSIASEHLVDVASSDRHTVKPWLASHADLSPPIADFARQGFSLVGGRVDFLEGVRAAVTVYRHNGHIINVFAWANYDEDMPDFETRNGYHIVFWKSGNITFCAISDTAVDDILQLSRLLKALSQTDARE